MPPETFGPYRVLQPLGRGGMGEVHRAYDSVRDREVALKRLLPALAADELFRARFYRECHEAARLREPHVVPIHDYGEIDGRLFLDMRLVDGQDLSEVLRTEGPLRADRAIEIVGQVASALDAAHAAGLVHRDVKPSNVLLCGDLDRPHCYLLDFGIAGTTGTGAGGPLTGTGMLVGTLEYIAPERLGDGPRDHRVDVYSLACLLHELLTGRPPFPVTDIAALYAAHLYRPPPRPSDTVPGLPVALDAVVAAGMAKDPDARPATAGDLARAARAAVVAGAGPSTGANPAAAVTAPRPRLTGARPAGPASRRASPAAPTPGGAGPHPAGPPAGGRRLRDRLLTGVLILAGLLAVAGPTAAALGVFTPDRSLVVLEMAVSVGNHPFMEGKSGGSTQPPDVASPAAGPDEPRVVDATVSGSEPGLYGGSGTELCDPLALAEFLDRRPALRSAWARAQGIDPAGIRDFLGTLTPVVLRVDTAVTNHGYADGRATPFQSVLQAGTAVLVDAQGIPRVRCACGNPLAAPLSRTDAVQQGERWPGYSASAVVVVERAALVEAFVVVRDDGAVVERRRGAGGSDVVVTDPLVIARTQQLGDEPPTATTEPPPGGGSGETGGPSTPPGPSSSSGLSTSSEPSSSGALPGPSTSSGPSTSAGPSTSSGPGTSAGPSTSSGTGALPGPSTSSAPTTSSAPSTSIGPGTPIGPGTTSPGGGTVPGGEAGTSDQSGTGPTGAGGTGAQTGTGTADGIATAVPPA